MKIQPIENNEQGLSVRNKLNRVLGLVEFECFVEGITEDDTRTELFIPDESEIRLLVPEDAAWLFEIHLMCFNGATGSGGDFMGGWRLTGGIINDQGTVELGKKWDSSNPTFSTGGRFDPAKAMGWHKTVTVLVGDQSNTFGDPDFEADDTNKSLKITVCASPYSSAEFYWAARVKIVQIIFAPS